MSRISQWSTTAADNDASPPDGWPEGQAPSTVNNCAREVMASVRKDRQDSEWFDWGDSVTFVSTTSFKIPSSDVSARYLVNRRLKLVDASTVYASIEDVTFSTDTTVTVRVDDGTTLTTSLTQAYIGIDSPTNIATPMQNIYRKNLVIGGNFQINPWQRGTSFTSVADQTYTADRWQWWQSGAGVVDISRGTSGPTVAQAGIYADNHLVIDVTTADATIGAGDYYQIQYIIEGYDFTNIAQRPFVISFWHAHTKTGTYTVAIQNSGQDRSYIMEYTQNAASAWEKTTLTLENTPSAGTWNYTTATGLMVWFTVAAGTDIHGAANSWISTNDRSTSNQVNAMDSASNFMRFNLVQIEEGRQATDFERRTFEEELLLCQRYYEKSYDVSTSPGTSTATSMVVSGAGATATDYVNVSVGFQVDKRTAPTVTIYDRAGNSGKATYYNNGVATDNKSVNSSGIGEKRFVAESDNSSTKNIMGVHFKADAEL
jgi:hypothetical protein